MSTLRAVHIPHAMNERSAVLQADQKYRPCRIVNWRLVEQTNPLRGYVVTIETQEDES